MLATATWPLLPPRPTATDAQLTPANAVEIVRDLETLGWLIQPKLNGDRVLLRKVDGIVEAWNRLGNRYSFSVNATADWRGLPDGTLLDGESWQGRFYPFEALRVGGQDLTAACVSSRADAAKELCRTLGNCWLFDRPADDWLIRCRENLPTWEGIVAKRIGSQWTPIKKAWHESPDWLKAKW